MDNCVKHPDVTLDDNGICHVCEAIKKATPVRIPAKVGSCRRWWSTNDPEELSKAILTLIQSECGYVVRLQGPAFKDPGCLEHDSTLEIVRTGYGIGDMGPKDVWHVYYEGKKVESFGNPEKAVECFFKVVEEHDLGHDKAEAGFAGHAGPPPTDKPRKLVIPAPKTDLEVGKWVLLHGSRGIIVPSPEPLKEGWYYVWFGSSEMFRVPGNALQDADPPIPGCNFSED